MSNPRFSILNLQFVFSFSCPEYVMQPAPHFAEGGHLLAGGRIRWFSPTAVGNGKGLIQFPPMLEHGTVQHGKRALLAWREGKGVALRERPE